MNYSNSESGFTLIELLLIIAIIGTLTGITAMASKEMFATYKLNGAARQLYSDMQYARLNAIKGGKEWVVDFDADGRYVVKPRGWVSGDKDRIKRFDISSQFKEVKVCATTDAEFNPNGSASGGAAVVSLGSKLKKVYVSSTGTGNVRIAKPGDTTLSGVTPCP